MPVNATIPIPADFLETAASYPFLTELTQHPTDGYLYGCYSPVGQQGFMVKVKADNFSDITTAAFANDGQHVNPVDMVYVPSTDRFYVLFRNGDANRCVISAVTPSTLARTDFFNFEDIQVGAGSITADATNLYVVTFPTDPSYLVIIPIAAPGTFAEPTPLTGFSQAHCIRQFGGKLFLQGMTPPVTGWVMRLTTAGVVEETATFTGEEGEFPVDEIGESASHIWVGNRDLSGEIRKYSKTSFINPEVILTAQLSKCTCVKTVGAFIWAAFENGRGVRINPSNVADRRIYTLNEGQGHHSEFTGGNEFVYTYNYFAGKIARYHIPSDVASGQTLSAIRIGGTEISDSAEVLSMALGQDGLFVAGKFNGTVNVGGRTITNPTLSSRTFVAKFSDTTGPTGVADWVATFAGTNTLNKPTKIVVNRTDNVDHVVVSGFFQIRINFGSGPDISSAGLSDGYVVKLNGTTGLPMWNNVFASTSGDSVLSLAVISDNHIVCGGYFASTVSFTGGSLISNGGFDGMLIKLNSDTGAAMWANKIGSTSSDQVISVAPWSDGVVVIGHFAGTVNFGGTSRTSLGSQDMFIATYNSAGALQWVSPPYGGTDALVYPVWVDTNANNEIAVTGYFGFGDVNFGGTPLPETPTTQIFIAKYTSAGAHVFSHGYGGTSLSQDFGYGVAIHSDGTVYATGACRNGIDFTGTGFAYMLGRATDVYTVRLEANGSFTSQSWQNRYIGPTDYDWGRCIIIDEPNGQLIVGGQWGAQINFGPTVGIITGGNEGANGYILRMTR